MTAEGQEVLVFDKDIKVQRGMEQLLRAAGLTPTTIADPERALELSLAKFFAVALVDLDTPGPDEGARILTEIKSRSPATSLIALSPRKSYDAAVMAFRAGAVDVVVKAPDMVDYLKNRVVALAATQQREVNNDKLIELTLGLHEELMNVLITTHRRAADLEEQHGMVSAAGDATTRILLVEDDGWLDGQLRASLDERGGFDLVTVSTGGEALDVAGRERFQIALIKSQLPDLPGSMVVRTIKAQSTDTLVLLLTPPEGAQAGSIQVIEGQRVIPFVPDWREPQQLLDRIGELREAHFATARERRHLATFRQQHFELLKRFADLRTKLQRAR